MVRSRTVFIAGEGAPVRTLLDGYGLELVPGKFYVVEVEEKRERIIAGPCDTEDVAQDAVQLEIRIDLAVAEHFPNSPNDRHFFFREGYRAAWRGHEIQTFDHTAISALFQFGYRVGDAERFAYDGRPTGLSNRAKSFQRFIGGESIDAVTKSAKQVRNA
jgi:hypothetical protein